MTRTLCACCGGGRWIRIASLNGRASRAGSLDMRTWRRLGSVGSVARMWTVGWSLWLVGSVVIGRVVSLLALSLVLLVVLLVLPLLLLALLVVVLLLLLLLLVVSLLLMLVLLVLLSLGQSSSSSSSLMRPGMSSLLLLLPLWNIAVVKYSGRIQEGRPGAAG